MEQHQKQISLKRDFDTQQEKSENKQNVQSNDVNAPKTKKVNTKQFEKALLEKGTHPMGIQPLGNLYFSLGPKKKNSRDVGLGTFSILSDELILDILAGVSSGILCKLSTVSKAFYVFCSQEELWKNLTISKFGGKFWFEQTWKKTFQMESYKQASQNSLISPPMLNNEDKIRIQDFYSDYLFQSWYCSSRDLDPKWSTAQNVDKRSNLSLSEFITKYEEPNIPVVITDVVTQWKAFSTWTKNYLVNSFGDVPFRAGAIDIKLQDYFHYSDTTTDESPIYLFDKAFCEKCPSLSTYYQVPIYFRDDLFSVLGKERPDFRWLIAGPGRSGSIFHKDPNSTSAWNGVIYGSKKWILYPPSITPPGVFPSRDGSEVTTSVSIIEWFTNYYPNVKEDTRVRPYECIVNAGELIFVPNGWWHCVINLEESVAITQNYVSPRNLKNVLKFTRDCPEQVSGYKCEQSLYENLVQGLEKSHPDLITKVLEDEQNEKEKSKFWEKLKTNADQPFTFSFDDE